MKFILEYKAFYKVGDIVLLEYWYNDMITPVKIIEKVVKLTSTKDVENAVYKIEGKTSKSRFKVSHDVDGSAIRNAPDEVIKTSQILDKHK
jgi:hypothetical protein